MKFYSEKTKKLYDTEKEAAAAEKEFDAAQERKLAAQKAEEERVAELKAKRAERAKERDALIKQRGDLEKQIDEKLRAFTKDYGTYHRTVTNSDLSNWADWISSVFRFL